MKYTGLGKRVNKAEDISPLFECEGNENYNTVAAYFMSGVPMAELLRMLKSEEI